MRHIPGTMATQHPDNASTPYWETDGDGFVSVHEELPECVSAFDDLGVQEFMWDWEGKHADEAVTDKLFTTYYDFCRRAKLGKYRFLTFRVPNIWHEKGYSLLRSLMVILTGEDFARDIKLKSNPLFEIILPMTERADQLIYIQSSFRKLAHFKFKIFNHTHRPNTDYLEIIPLVESIEGQVAIRTLLNDYYRLHVKEFGRKPKYLRPFLARSDPAMVSGLIATVLANKVALSEMIRFSRDKHVPLFPIIGVGSLVFRGGLNPDTVESFLNEYRGVRTVTVQSAFRYDYPLSRVKQAIRRLNKTVGIRPAALINKDEQKILQNIIHRSASFYQESLHRLIKEMSDIFTAVPRRRERRLHIGFLSYGRSLGKQKLPRAINFTAGFYSLGIPPEFMGVGRLLASLSESELALVKKYYVNLRSDLERAGRFLNRSNLNRLAQNSKAWRGVAEDVMAIEEILQLKLGPRTTSERLHANLAEQLLILRKNKTKASQLIVDGGKLRKSLG